MVKLLVISCVLMSFSYKRAAVRGKSWNFGNKLRERCEFTAPGGKAPWNLVKLYHIYEVEMFRFASPDVLQLFVQSSE